MKRALLAASLAMAVAGTAVLVSRLPSSEQHPPTTTDPLAAFNAALRRHDYKRAFGLTDLSLIIVQGASPAIDVRYFSAVARSHRFADLTLSQGLVHIPTTALRLSAPTGPLPSAAIDGVSIRLRASRLRAKGPAAYTYRYSIVVISGPHTLTIGAGPVTAARTLEVRAAGSATAVAVPLAISGVGNRRVVFALDSIVRTCAGQSCVVTPCAGSGPEYVVDAWGIGTPPITARVLVGDRLIAPMPPNGWSIAITFVDQAQPPGLSGREQTKTLHTRFVFGFVGGGRAQLLDKCWVSAG